MPRFRVQFEAVITGEATIEADSAEEAARIARTEHTKPQSRMVTMWPTWLETEEKAKATGEFFMEIMGLCCRCGEGVINRHDRDEPHPRGWPWSWTTLDEHGEEVCCYACYEAPLKQLAEQSE